MWKSKRNKKSFYDPVEFLEEIRKPKVYVYHVIQRGKLQELIEQKGLTYPQQLAQVLNLSPDEVRNFERMLMFSAKFWYDDIATKITAFLGTNDWYITVENVIDLFQKEVKDDE